jgi:hypothetical protein
MILEINRGGGGLELILEDCEEHNLSKARPNAQTAF